MRGRECLDVFLINIASILSFWSLALVVGLCFAAFKVFMRHYNIVNISSAFGGDSDIDDEVDNPSAYTPGYPPNNESNDPHNYTPIYSSNDESNDKSNNEFNPYLQFQEFN